MHPWMLVGTTHVTEFEYYFAYTRKGVHLYFVMSPGKMIFVVLELHGVNFYKINTTNMRRGDGFNSIFL